MAKVVQLLLNDEILNIETTLLFIQKPLNILKISQLVDIAVSECDWNFNLGKVIVGSSLLAVLLHIYFGAKVPSHESLISDNLGVMSKISPAGTGWRMRSLIAKSCCIIDLLVKIEEAFLHQNAEAGKG